MSASDQVRNLLQKGADFRRGIFGINPAGAQQLARMEDQPDTAKTYACYFSSGKSQEALEAMMLFKELHDNVVRVAKTESNFDPTIGKVVRLIAANTDGSDLLVRIAEIQTSALNPEYVCGCKAKW